MLEGRRVAGQNQMLGRMRTIRDGATTVDRRVPDDLEGGIQEDIDLALLQINSEIVDKITDALARLEGGSYGVCNECGEEIAEKRLRALPFAARCRNCQESFEASERSHRAVERRSADLRLIGSLERYSG
jgi:RNA polymerase-binding transcription factor DksA